jgi:hypothetical protein
MSVFAVGKSSLVLILCFADVQGGAPLYRFATFAFCKIVYIPPSVSMCKRMIKVTTPAPSPAALLPFLVPRLLPYDLASVLHFVERGSTNNPARSFGLVLWLSGCSFASADRETCSRRSVNKRASVREPRISPPPCPVRHEWQSHHTGYPLSAARGRVWVINQFSKPYPQCRIK